MLGDSGISLTADQLQFLRIVDSPTIANAIEPFNVRDRCDGFIGGDVRALFPDLGVMVGHALTVTMTNRPGPAASRDGYWQMWKALEQTPAPSVLVIQDESGDPRRVAYAGEVMATMAQRLGAVGMVTDGGFRDLNEVRTLGMHYFARYAVVSHANFEIVSVGEPITVGGQIVQPGDVLHGDANGIVIVPPSVLDRLPDAVAGVRERERQTMEFVRSDGFTLDEVKRRSGY